MDAKYVVITPTLGPVLDVLHGLECLCHTIKTGDQSDNKQFVNLITIRLG